MSGWDEILDAFGELPQMSAALDALTGLLEHDVTVMIHPTGRHNDGRRPVQMAAVLRGVLRHGQPRLSQTFADEPETETVFLTVGEDYNGFYLVASAVQAVEVTGDWIDVDMGSVRLCVQGVG
jgi:hypothetical protein